MPKTEMIRARVEPNLKHEAEEIFAALGLSATEAIKLFYRQVSLHHGLPFEVRIPNADTLDAIRQASNKDGLSKYGNAKDLMTEIDDA